MAEGAEQLVFKICSTFDSTPQGNIGPVLDALAERMNAEGVVVCPAFPETGRSVYQGHLFVGDRLLSESGMQDHPLTPMTDPDLRRVLAAQSRRPVDHLPASLVWRGAEAMRQALAATAGHVIVDAVRDADLAEIGRAVRGAPLLCGGSGIALGLPANFGATPATPAWTPVEGPAALLSGSCSRTTRGQIAAWSGPSCEITAESAIDGVDVDQLADWALDQAGPMLLYSSATPETVAAAQRRFGPDAAEALETLFGRLAVALVARGLRRLIVAGGETSGAVVSALGIEALRIGPRVAAGVPLMRATAGPPLALALKSGNFGGTNFFAKALDLMEGA